MLGGGGAWQMKPRRPATRQASNLQTPFRPMNKKTIKKSTERCHGKMWILTSSAVQPHSPGQLIRRRLLRHLHFWNYKQRRRPGREPGRGHHLPPAIGCWGRLRPFQHFSVAGLIYKRKGGLPSVTWRDVSRGSAAFASRGKRIPLDSDLYPGDCGR